MGKPLINLSHSRKRLYSLCGVLKSEAAGVLIIIASSFLYFFLAFQTSLLGGDNGEFVFLSRSAGIAHPPGYPLYTLYLRLTSWVPGTPASSTALATAFLGSAQVAVQYLALRAWRATPLGSSIALAIYSTSFLAISYYTHAEVFALNCLLASVLLLVASPGLPLPGAYRLSAIGLVLGLGFSNHHSFVFLLPIALGSLSFWCWMDRPRAHAVLRGSACAFFLLITGLLPYLLLLNPWHRPSELDLPMLSWGSITDLDGLIHHFLRRDYGTFRLAGGGQAVNYPLQIRWLLDNVYWSWHIALPFLLVGLAAFVLPFYSKSKSLSRQHFIALVASIILSGPILLLGFNLGNPAIAERFHFLPVMLLSFPVAYGVDMFACCLSRFRLNKPSCNAFPAVPSVGFIATISLSLWFFGAFLGLRRTESLRSGNFQAFLENGLLALPRDSVVMVLGDHMAYGYEALQQSYKLRRDIVFISPDTLAFPWYQKRVFRRLGLHESSANLTKPQAIARVASHSLKSRPLFVQPILWDPNNSLRAYNYGVWLRVLPDSVSPPSPARIFDLNRDIFSLYQLPSRNTFAGEYWSNISLRAYSSAWSSIAASLVGPQNAALRSRCLAYAKRYSLCFEYGCKIE